MRKNLFVRLVHRITTGKSIYRILLTPVAPLFFFGFVAGLVFASIMTDAWFGSGKIIQPPWNIWLSRPFMLSGLFLMGWSASRFFKARGTPVPFNPPKRLVTTGPYAWSRNPMMSGLFFVLFGIGIRLVSFSLIFFYLPLFIMLINIMVKMVEEPGLEERFKDEYRYYKENTPRFFLWRKPDNAKNHGTRRSRGR